VNFIDYKRTAHWLPRISKGIADRLIHDPIERTNEPTKLLKCLQEYERCLSAAITIVFFLGNTDHDILLLYILVIVCVNLTSNAVIFKRIADMSLLIDFCNDYRTYLCWQVSSIIFSIIISSFDFNLFKSLISRGEKNLHHQPPCVRLMFDTIEQHISLARSRSTQSLGINLSIHDH